MTLKAIRPRRQLALTPVNVKLVAPLTVKLELLGPLAGVLLVPCLTVCAVSSQI